MSLQPTAEAQYLSLKQRSREHVNKTVSKMKPIVKDWFLHTAYGFINSRNFTNQEEDLMEEISDWYLARLEEL